MQHRAALACSAALALVPWCTACGKSEEPAGDPSVEEVDRATPELVAGAARESPEAADATAVRQPRPGTWLARYDDLDVVLESPVGWQADAARPFRTGAGSVWQVGDVILRNGRVSFELRYGGALRGRVVRFEGVFSEQADELQGTVYDGAEKRSLVFQRRP